MPRTAPIEDRLMSFVQFDPNGGCWLYAGTDTGKSGYGQIVWNRRKALAHRCAYELFVGKVPEGQMVLHRCDVRACCNPEHLFLGDNRANMQDMKKKGRSRYTGPRQLSWTDVREIRGSNEPGVSLALRYGMSPSAISNIRVGKTWKETAP